MTRLVALVVVAAGLAFGCGGGGSTACPAGERRQMVVFSYQPNGTPIYQSKCVP